MSEENLSVSTESVVAPVETAAEPIPEAAPPPSPKLEDLLTPGELAAVHAARKQAVVDAGKAGAPKGKREVVGLLALHGFAAVERGGALRIDFEPIRLREVANTVVNVIVARGVRFGPLDAKGPTIEGRYDVMEEAACLLISGVDDKAIGGGS